MILYSVKPKLQLVLDNLQMSQSNDVSQHAGVNNYRMKPKQFQKEEVVLFDIPVLAQPHRIPGTKIGIMTSEVLNRGGRKDEEQMSNLLVQVQLAIECMKRVSHQSKNVVEFKYDALEIVDDQMDLLSHKQQLQVLNDLVNLRTAVKQMAHHDQRWVEVISTGVRDRSSFTQNEGPSARNQSLQSLPLSVEQDKLKKAELRSPPPQPKPAPVVDMSPPVAFEEKQVTAGTDLLNLSKRPPPPPEEEPPQEVLRRPLSPQAGPVEPKAERPTEKKRYTSKYRTIAEFLAGYESSYKQFNNLSQARQRQQRDFIQENIENQQYYKKNFARKQIGEDGYLFDQDTDHPDDQLSELMMRITMQQLCFKANNGDQQAFKRLAALQERYKRLFETPATELKSQQTTQVKVMERTEKPQPTEEFDEFASKQELAAAQRAALKRVMEERIAAQQVERRKREYKVLLPQFNKEQVSEIKGMQKQRMKAEEDSFRERVRTAVPNSILINKRNPDFERQFGELCDRILKDVADSIIRDVVDKVSEVVQKKSE